jgi:pyridoxamine 5'-phosphate oxidase
VDERDLLPDPLAQFGAWYEQAPELRDAMALATAAPSGAPSVRMVLLKGFDEQGFTFHTSYASRKGRELEANPQAALLFHWREQGRQVRVEGTVERTSREDSEAYYRTRPAGARLSAAASPQSSPIGSRAELEALVEQARARHGDDPPLPEHWGGFRVVPSAYEFWVHGDDRLHDRFRYERAGDAWRMTRLAP